MPEIEYINFIIDGRQGRAPKGTLIITAAERMGIYIPRFCHHDKLVPYAGCRMCLVEIEKMPKLMASCSVPVAEGMVISTTSERVKKNQRAILEFILINHPTDCPICDKGGECPLQDQYYEYSASLSRFTEDKIFNPHAPLNSTIEQDFNRCVLCKRCVRFSYEVATDDLIIYEKRGVHTTVTSFDRRPYESAYSGNIIELCPVGALTDKVFRFRCRPWELNHKNGVCIQCSQHCHIDQQYRSGEMMRIFSREFDPINESWICDKGRFNHQYLKSENRITKPMEKVDGKWREIDWRRALDLIVSQIKKTLEENGPGAIGAVIENDHTLEELSLFRKLMWEIIKTPNFDTNPSMRGLRTEKNDYFLRNLPTYEQIATSDAVLNLGCDLVSEAPLLAIKMRKNMLANLMKPFNLMTIPSETIKLIPEIVIPYHEYSSVIAELVRRISMDDRIDDSSRNSILSSLENIQQTYPHEFDQTIDTISELVKTQKVALIIGRAVLKQDSTVLSLVKILMELIERIQKIPVIMPILLGGNSIGAELMKVHPMLSSSGAGGELEHTGGQFADDFLKAAIHGKIKTLMIFSNRYGINIPKYEWERGLENIDYVIWADYFINSVNENADLILPLQSPYEKSGHVVNNELRFEKLINPVKPADGIMPTLEILIRIAKGMDTSQQLDSDILIKEILADTRFGEKLSPGGFVFTQTKRDYISRLKKLEPPKQIQTDDKFPFVLIPCQPFWHGDSAILNSPDVKNRLPEFKCVMCPSDAQSRNLIDAQRVQISTEHGSLKAVLELNDNMPAGYISLPMGYIEKSLGNLTLSGKDCYKVKAGNVYTED